MEFELKNESSNSFEEETFESDDEMELQTPGLRRSSCLSKSIERYRPPDFCSDFVLSTINDEPRSVKEVVSSEECKLWKNFMVEEMETLDKNEVWYFFEFPNGRKLVGSKWVFKHKLMQHEKSRSTKLDW